MQRLFEFLQQSYQKVRRYLTGEDPPERSAGPNGDSSSNSSEEDDPDPSEVRAAPSRPSLLDRVRALLPDPLTGSASDPASNEQPTNYNPVTVGAGLVLFTVVLMVSLFIYPNLSGSDSSEPERSPPGSEVASSDADPQQAVEGGRETIPGSRSSTDSGSDPSRFYTPDTTASASRQRSRSTAPPRSPDTSSSAGSDGITADPSNADEYIDQVQQQARQSNDKPPGASGSSVPENPYATSGGGGGRRGQRLQKAMSSDMSVKTKPPGNFDPNKEGVPRHPASGRPIGTPPTPSESRKEAQYEEDQEEPSPREDLRRRYPASQSLSQNEQFLARQRARSQTEVQVNEVKGPFKPFVIPKGTIIPVALETGANNQLPGATIMRVTRDVYDRTMRHILIPRGSEIISSYSTATQVGQSRVLVSANRLNLPDGRFVKFSDARAAGPQGFAGMEDVKDRHLLERFGAAGALAVLGAVVNASNPLSFLGAAQQDSTGVIAGGGFRGRVSISLSQQVNQIIGQLLQKQVNRKPTLRLRPGLRGLLIINEDIDMKRPYYEGGGDFQQQNQQYNQYRRERRNREMRRALQRVRQMMNDQKRRERLRERARELSSQIQPSSSSRPPRPRPASRPSPAQVDYFVDEVRASGRSRAGTFLPPRRGPTARERFLFGENYRRVPPPGTASQEGSGAASSPSASSGGRSAAPPRSSRSGASTPSSSSSSSGGSAPDFVRQMREATRREMPANYVEPDRPLYNRQRSDNRYTRGKQNYRPRSTGGFQSSPNRRDPPPGSPGNPVRQPPPAQRDTTAAR